MIYGVTIFVGAFLLFQLQPIIGKYLLPWFGGGPGVWAVCLFFFQIALLGGYAYAHVLNRFFSRGRQVLVHLGLVLGALACLPITPAAALKSSAADQPWMGILSILARTVGLPYFLLASTSPLIQSWYGQHARTDSAYRLYALSNVASFLALLSYPSFFEPHLTRQAQAKWWDWGFVTYALFCAGCAVTNWRKSRRQKGVAGPLIEGGFSGVGQSREQATEVKGAKNSGEQGSRVTARQRVFWIFWPACASALLLATTNKLCLDVATFPFLWIAPLSLYLLSFVICFDNPRWYSPRPYTVALVLILPCLCWALFHGATWSLGKQVPVYCGSLLACCLVCHGEVFRIRPGTRHLTEFYLMIAAGGALGGLFVSMVSPAIFTSYCELNWSLAVFGFLLAITRTCSIWPSARPSDCSLRSELRLGRPGEGRVTGPSSAAGGGNRMEWGALGVALLWLGSVALAATLWLQARRENPEIVYRSRNFYGVLTVFEHRKDELRGHHYLLQHGRITHGLQLATPELQGLATTYYGGESGLGLALKSMTQKSRRIGVIGLGAGTIATYARGDDFLQFYEINPAVREMASTRFTYLEHCKGGWSVTPGDARLSLEKQPTQNFDLLALDAFSSDAIPVHLLTREAFRIYLSHLKANGVIAVHISNHFLNLEPVVLGLAREFGLHQVVVDHDADPAQWWIYSSTWVLLTRDEQFLTRPAIQDAAQPKLSTRRVPIWTDDYCSVFGILR